MKTSWPGEDCPSSPVAPMPDTPQGSPRHAVSLAFRDNTSRSPHCSAHPLATRGFGAWTQMGQVTEMGQTVMELVMSSKSIQWTLWALVMMVFTGLTLTGRWMDLAVAMTVVAVLWYGIVPEARSGRQ